VNITKNNVFAGVTSCQDDGTFNLLVDLFDGANFLLARVMDALGQYGPDSAGVNVFYDAPVLKLPGGDTGKQLFLEVATTVLAVDPGQTSSRSAIIVGGVGPYAVSWDFGDGETQLTSQSTDGVVTGRHVYARPGTYRVILRVTDAQGNAAFIQVITVVNGPSEKIGATNGNGLGAVPGLLLTAWPLYGLALIMVALFWLGERRGMHNLRKKQLIAN
jgi:hypothetical protein